MAMKETVVLYPGLGVGHLSPMVELADRLLRHGFAVTIVAIEPPSRGTFPQVISRFISSHPTISFHVLPPVPPPSNSEPPKMTFSFLLPLYSSHLQEYLVSLSQTSSIRAVVLDFFCTDARHVASDLGIPAYYLFPSGASDLAVFLHLSTFGATTATSFKDMGKTLVHFPGLRGIPASDFPSPMLDRNSESYKILVSNFAQLPDSDGIFVNSFESLEPGSVRALKDGLCLPDRTTPDIYCVGPLIAGGVKKEEGEKHECLKWLDDQPNGCVVFLCFGSMGSFSLEQLKEMATGLENSGQRFLWVVQSPANPDPAKRFEQRPEPDLDKLLPEGFVDRTRERGFVVKSWAPQVEVLGHAAIGGFVTHCGWNSTLEGIMAGVPLICWPLYAEQRMNKVFIVEEMEVGVEIEGYDADVVKAEELEKKIRWVMESEEGNVTRKRVNEMKERAKEAISEGGSSCKALIEFVQKIRHE